MIQTLYFNEEAMSFLNSGLKAWDSLVGRGVHNAGRKGGMSDLINLSNGNHILQTTDFKLPFFNMPLSFRRIYNSLLDESGMFGIGWSSNFDMKIINDGDDRLFIDAFFSDSKCDHDYWE